MTQPKFTPKPGQVDYTNIRYCPVVNVIPVCDGKLLFVQRAADLSYYPGYWHCIAGFLDDAQSIEDKVYEELSEELGWAAKDVLELKHGQVVVTEAPEYNKTYLVVPILAKVSKATIKLDWEASRAQWFDPSEVKELKLLPGFLEIVAQFFPEVVSRVATTNQIHEKESHEQLLKRMHDASQLVTVGGRYWHYKDHKHTYTVLKVALREEDNEPCVVYEAEYMPGTIWIRPLSSWLEEVEVDGKKVNRFTKIEA